MSRDAALVSVIELPHTTTASAVDSKVTIRSFRLVQNGVSVELCSLGASVTKLLLPRGGADNFDHNDDVVLGYDSPSSMLSTGNPAYLGVVVGRVANRIGNAKFCIRHGTEESKSEQIRLDANNGPNHLHGGVEGFGRRNWDASIVTDNVGGGGCAVRFELMSQHGDQGYPAGVHVSATYALVPLSPKESGAGGGGGVIVGATLRLTMRAALLPGEKQATPINLAQHSYFNLNSHGTKNGIAEHILTLPNCSRYTPVDDHSIPTKEVKNVTDDPVMDFRQGRVLGDALAEYQKEKVGPTGSEGVPYGFDHNYVINGSCDALRVTGVLEHPASGRKMTVSTDAPGVQLYTANYLNRTVVPASVTKDGATYGRWQGVCLETQAYPDSILPEDADNDSGIYDGGDFNRGRCFVLRSERAEYKHQVEYKFEVSSHISSL